MKAYSYDIVTNEYVGPVDVDPDPLDAENIPFPAFSTLIEPPEIPEGYQCHFVDGEWVLTEIPPVEVDYSAETNANFLNCPTGLFGGPTLGGLFRGY